MITSSKVIGFATQYYTLWNQAIIDKYETIDGNEVLVGRTYNFNYMQNLSKIEDKAIQKVRKMFKIADDVEVYVDESLRGISNKSFSKYVAVALPYTVFPFGRYMHCNISNCEDVYQLNNNII